MDANTLLWIGQVVLALGLLAAGYGHAIDFDRSAARRGMVWLAAVGRTQMRAIGSLEILAAVGLILLGVTGVLPWLTPTAAACVVVLMILAAIFHARRPGEGQNIVTNLVIGLLAALVAYGRFIVAPF
jgi:uncharacterized membrane protein YphA (DoxX/SURF4 family)